MPKFFYVLMLLTLSLNAEESQWPSSLVSSYVHHSELQRRWAMQFLTPHLKELRGDEKILDIGCGDGKVTADIANFVPAGLVIGIDHSADMIAWAQKQYYVKEYPALHFKKGDFLEPNLDMSFDRIVSLCALQHCADIEGAIHQLNHLLKPGGQLLILVPAMKNAAWNQARINVQSLPQWSPYWQNYRPRRFLESEDYRNLLEDLIWADVKVKKVETADPFVDREEFVQFMIGTFGPSVPRDLAPEFYGAWVDEYVRLSPESLNSKGVINARFGYLTIEAKRSQ